MIKKKPTLTILKEHTTTWAKSRLNDARETVEDLFMKKEFNSYPQSLREDIINGFVVSVEDLLVLLEPFDVPDEFIIEWANNFVLEHSYFDEEDEGGLF